MNEIKWGIIGCGNVCEVKSGPAFSKIEHSELVAVMRRDSAKAEDYASRHKVPTWYSDADELINDPEVNAIYIATPPGFHAFYTKKVAAAGKPVYVEKPMGRNYQECEVMIEACKKAGVPLFVAYYRRMLPYFLKVKELLESKTVGEITSVQLNLIHPPKSDDFKPESEDDNWRTKPEISGGGYFHDLASHQLDLLEYLLGDINEISGNAVNRMGWYKAADVITASFKFESGMSGTGLWNFTALAKHKRDEIILTGSKGTISFSCFDGTVPVVLENESERKEFSLPYPAHVQQPLIQTIVDDLRGKDKSPSTGKTGARANWLMDKILE